VSLFSCGVLYDSRHSRLLIQERTGDNHEPLDIVVVAGESY
jgi:hypothetical protein